MKIKYLDFSPIKLPKIKVGDFIWESLDQTITRASDWVSSNGINVINIETVLLPNVYDKDTSMQQIHTSGENSSSWFQIVRIWFQE